MRSLLEDIPGLKRFIKMLYINLGSIIGKFYKPYYLNEAVRINRFAGNSDLFFGYYDLNPFREGWLLGHAVKQDEIGIKVIDTNSHMEIELGETLTWNYQQGARLGWAGSSSSWVHFNSSAEGAPNTTLVNRKTHERKSFPMSLQIADKNFGTILGLDIHNINRFNPDYGYSNLSEPSKDSTQSCGIKKYSIAEERTECLVPLAKILDHEPMQEASISNSEVNHLSYSPGETKLAFIHRWYPEGGQRASRLLIYDFKTRALITALSHGMVSHYCWESEERLFVYGTSDKGKNEFISIDLPSGKEYSHSSLAGMRDGHPSLSPSGEWIIFDSYPGLTRHQNLYLYHLETEKVQWLGKFYSPREFSYGNRCDLHPRWCSDTEISIDSACNGKRELLLLDIASCIP